MSAGVLMIHGTSMPDSKTAQSVSEAGARQQIPGFADVAPSNAFWHRIERMLAEIAALAKHEPMPPDFPAGVLVSLHTMLPTSGGIFWSRDRTGQLRQSACHFPGDEWGDAPENCPAFFEEPTHLRLVRAVLAEGTARSSPLELQHVAESPHAAVGCRHGTLLLCPIKTEGDCTAVLEVLVDDHASLDEQLLLEVLRSVAELCADYLRRSQLKELSQERSARDQLAQFARRAHDSLDLSATAYTIANEGRQLIGCDRVTVLACRGRDCQTLAVSGAASWDRRSNTIAGLERLASAVAERGEPLIFHEETAGLPPQVRIPLEAYLEVVQAREVIVVPLLRRSASGDSGPHPVGVLIVEQFSGVLTEASRERTAEICDLCSPALAHALDFQRIPWARLFRDHDWRSWLRRGRVVLVACACLAVLLLAACIIPTDYLIEARGVLEPRNRRDVFAPNDGIVDELLVDHGTSVAAGQPLVMLRNPQLDLDLKRVWGELQASRKRLAAIETARVEGTNASTTTPVAAARLSGEDAELQEQVASLTRQHRLLQEHQAELNVSSPIAGQVLTWDLPQLLQGRPVHRGQVLMIVADPKGPWQLELEVPDRDAGNLIEAREQAGSTDLEVTYLIATDPGTRHAAVIERVAFSIERSHDGEPALRAIVKIDEGGLPNSRPGSTVIAKIHCGRRSLAFVWLHDVYYAIMTRLLF